MAVTQAWDWGLVPRKILSTGTITTKDGLTLPTRKYGSYLIWRWPSAPPQDPLSIPLSIKKKHSEELQLPSGRWIACRMDCLETYERYARKRSIPAAEFRPESRR